MTFTPNKVLPPATATRKRRGLKSLFSRKSSKGNKTPVESMGLTDAFNDEAAQANGNTKTESMGLTAAFNDEKAKADQGDMTFTRNKVLPPATTSSKRRGLKSLFRRKVSKHNTSGQTSSAETIAAQNVDMLFTRTGERMPSADRVRTLAAQNVDMTFDPSKRLYMPRPEDYKPGQAETSTPIMDAYKDELAKYNRANMSRRDKVAVAAIRAKESTLGYMLDPEATKGARARRVAVALGGVAAGMWLGYKGFGAIGNGSSAQKAQEVGFVPTVDGGRANSLANMATDASNEHITLLERARDAAQTTNEAGVTPKFNFEINPNDYPFDVAKRSGLADPEGALHRAGDAYAERTGAKVEWHLNPSNGTEWVSVDGLSGTEDVMARLGEDLAKELKQ